MAVHVVLFEPEIPQNTGNILRTCVATKTKVHIIRPLGFELNHDNLKRAASNHLDLAEYDFYDSHNIYITGKDNRSLKEFIEVPVRPVPEEIRNRYRFSAWLERFSEKD